MSLRERERSNRRDGSRRWSGVLLVVCHLVAAQASAEDSDLVARWGRPVPPFRILGNLHYVGANEIAAFLITTPEGHVLLDGGFGATASLIAESIEALGFEVGDVEILLNSHAHFDHAGGLAELKRRTGARLLAMEGDVEALRTGEGELGPFPPVEVDETLRDGDRVELGGVALVAHRTAGHTPGCTTWTLEVEEAGESYDVVIVGSPTALPQHRLVDNPDYPEIAADFERTFERLRSLSAEVFLAAHGSFFGLGEKRARMEAGEDGRVFVDPEGYGDFVDRTKRQFRRELERQRARSVTGGERKDGREDAPSGGSGSGSPMGR